MYSPIRSALLALVALALFAAPAAAPAAAPERYERKPRRTLSVAFTSFQNYYVDEETIFREEGDALPMDDVLRAAATFLESRLDTVEHLDFVSARKLRDALTADKRYRDGILLAREWFNLGVGHFRALRLDRAVEYLDRAQKLYLEVFQDLVEPYALAELEFYRGLTLAEMGKEELAHVAFKRMFFFNPWKRFQRGYHAEASEKAFRRALVDLKLSGNRDYGYASRERIEEALIRFDLDAVLYGYLGQGPDGLPTLHVRVFDKRQHRITFSDNTPLRGDGLDEERLDRLVTRWLSCADWPTRKTDDGSQNKTLFIDAGVTYFFYLTQPISEIFHNLGFAVSGAYQLTDAIDLHAQFALSTTQPDSERDIIGSASTSRVIVGAGFTFRNRYLRLFIHPGIEFSHLGRLKWTTNPDCKFCEGFDSDWPCGTCEDHHIHSLSPPYLVGLNLTVGLDTFLTPDLFLNVRLASSSYFLPVDHIDVLNFPLTFQLGLGYAF